uniref:Family with sequence similarity 110 member A n=1 Tax=Amazona collaria TaxID=241587 RepID=A0A8B9FMR5_9PSIT
MPGVPVPVSAPFTSAMPIRILRKGPAYFRRGAEPGAGKPSAVERLEADKAKYVKSQRVASTRQEPVKPPLLKQPLFTPGVRRAVLTPSRRALPGPRRAEPAGTKACLDLEILNNLINLCDSPFPKGAHPGAGGSAGAVPRRGVPARGPAGTARRRLVPAGPGRALPAGFPSVPQPAPCGPCSLPWGLAGPRLLGDGEMGRR